MEKSIKRVEKLLRATNSVLVQMKFNLMFDDLKEDLIGKYRSKENLEPTAHGNVFLERDDLKLCQDEFKAEANEMLAKMETMFKSNELPRKNSKAVDRIKEINRKMYNLRLEHSKPTETQESLQKLLSLIGEEEFSPRKISLGKEPFRSKLPVLKRHQEKSHSNFKKADSIVTIAVSPAKPKEELREKVLETQEIVNRGFQTARNLTQKVESMTKREKKEKTVSDINLRSLHGKSENNENIHSVKCKRCSKEKNKKQNVEELQEVNARLIEMKRNYFHSSKKSNLQFQRLPSLHIREGLQLQKIHILEIPASGEVICEKSNTAVKILSHEDMEKEKMSENTEKVKKENCIAKDPQKNYIECFNCGKLIRIRGTRADPQEVDKILQKCNYNVFDPRIDEFAEKCGTVSAFLNLCSNSEPSGTVPPIPKAPEEVSEKVKAQEKSPKRRHTIQNFSNQLLRKYQEEADTIEGNHLKLDSILQNLFRKVDESREVFKDCRLLKNRKNSNRVPVLTATKPVLISVSETSLKGRRVQRKLDVSRKRIDSLDIRTEAEKSYAEKAQKGIISGIYGVSNENAKTGETGGIQISTTELTKQSNEEKEGEERVSATSTSATKIGNSVRMGKESIQLKIVKELDRISKKEETGRKLFLTSSTYKPIEIRQEEMEKEKPTSETSPPTRIIKEYNRTQEKANETERRESSIVEEKLPLETSSEKSENNYESDFESMTNEPEEIGDQCKDQEPEKNPLVEKLSTISEVDSELEKKLSHESNKSRKTEATLPKTEPSLKNTQMDTVTSLKGILSAIQEQFARTESLAEKLTEKAIREKEKPDLAFSFPEDGMLNPWQVPKEAKLFQNLQSARKDLPKSPKIFFEGEKSWRSNKSGGSLSDEGGSSLGEIILCDRKRKIFGKFEGRE